ncbi:MAG: hypothetical protein ACI8PD_001672 [Nitrospinales bacterium]
MKKILSHYIPIALVAFLVNGIADWSPLLLDSLSGSGLVKHAEASGKGNDKGKDIDYTKADCKNDTGICNNQATVTVKGMTGKINVRSGSGAVRLDVTSSDVDLASMSGDLSGKGLNGKGKFKTEIGNVRVKYCEQPQVIGNKELKVEIKDNAGDSGSDAKIVFPKDSTFKIEITYDSEKYRSDFTHDSSADFKLTGTVALGYLVMYKYTNPGCSF